VLWVLLFVGIALGGLAVLAALLLRLWRKAGGLLEEVGVAADQAGELMDLLAQVGVPAPDGAARPDRIVEEDLSSWTRT
jgi:hypothetical protein